MATSMPATGGISLAELMHHYRDLLVSPICWTSRHLEILGCRFEHIANHAPTESIDGLKVDIPKWRPPTEEEYLANDALPSTKRWATARLLMRDGTIFNRY
ncbi:uncharacterized protein N7459_004225 [Penicillium hispanicum]|uniref:uncharacterized protein n=1 Tax=Penicillium hispanicum TaxID=1080232 RepID=UPI0025421376|nr:uncharacterized protein N7459_004225 [Penicillium hispanicum]KAJ5584425.1 hypothetical protein N7459_004225 [Penicillium hispanicum]